MYAAQLIPLLRRTVSANALQLSCLGGGDSFASFRLEKKSWRSFSQGDKFFAFSRSGSARKRRRESRLHGVPPNSHSPPPQGWKKKASTETRLLLTGVEIFTHRCCGAGARCLPRLPSSISGNTRTEYFHMCGAFNKHSFPLEKVSSNKRPCCSNPLLARRGQKKFFSARRQLAAGEGGGFFLLASPPCLVLNK